MASQRLKKIDEAGTGRKTNKKPRATLCPSLLPLHPQTKIGISASTMFSKNPYEKLESGRRRKKNIGLGKEPADVKMGTCGNEDGRHSCVGNTGTKQNVLSRERLKHILFLMYWFDHFAFQQNLFSFRSCLTSLCLLFFVLEGTESS